VSHQKDSAECLRGTFVKTDVKSKKFSELFLSTKKKEKNAMNRENFIGNNKI